MASRIVAPDTSSTYGIYGTLRRALLEYVDPINGQSIASLTGGRSPVYVVANHEQTPVYPYLTLRLTMVSDTGTNSYRQTANLEVMVLGKPAAQAVTVEALADLCDAALTGYTEMSSGVMCGRGRTRQTVPRFDDPADRDVVAVMLDYTLFLWPRTTTDRAPNAPTS
jgi:hypothetical protein